MNTAALLVAAARNGFRTTLAYRWDFMSSGFYTVFFVLVQGLLWGTVYGSAGLTEAGGLSLAQMRTYMLLAGLLHPLLGRSGVDNAVAGEVLEGELSLYLVRPVPHLGHRLAVYAGERLAWALAYAGPLAAALGVAALPGLAGRPGLLSGWFVGPPAGHGGWLPFAAALAVGAAIAFLIDYALGLCAFWFGQIRGLLFMKGFIANLAAGGLFPPEILPPFVQSILHYLPWRYMISVPAAAFQGRVSGTALAAELAGGLVWVLALGAAAAALWRSGLRRFTAQGG